ncbi:hypothetical protein BKA66DRAFT_445346 [Pyrenochaeta sp. MPI-SDFR-AT-0127]|nr:hypothetical protein BKA66DRAFT_445346 [Pyrenochaeta sp. MPI-SDFR-AT-0127]
MRMLNVHRWQVPELEDYVIIVKSREVKPCIGSAHKHHRLLQIHYNISNIPEIVQMGDPSPQPRCGGQRPEIPSTNHQNRPDGSFSSEATTLVATATLPSNHGDATCPPAMTRWPQEDGQDGPWTPDARP